MSEYIRLPRSFYHNDLLYDTITLLGTSYARTHGNAAVIAFMEIEDSDAWDDDDPIHAVQAASFEEYEHPTDPLPESMIESLQTHVCGKKLSSACPICLEFPQKNDVVYRLKCKHYIHVDCAKGWFDVASKCPVCTKPICHRPATIREESKRRP